MAESPRKTPVTAAIPEPAVTAAASRWSAAKITALGVAGFSTLLLLSSFYPVFIHGLMPAFGFYLHAIALVYTVFGVLIIVHQPRNTVGWLILLVGFLAALSVIPLDPNNAGNIESDALLFLVLIVGELVWIIPMFVPITLVLQFFPDGRLLSPQWRALTVLTILALFLTAIQMAAVTLFTLRQGTFDPENLPDSGGTVTLLEYLSSILMVIAILGSLAALIYRFRRSQGVERLQMKWLVYTTIVLVLLIFLTMVIFGDESPFTAAAFASFPIWFAVAMSIAILRYRLFDIDIIIRRTLQYGLLTAVLVAIYFGIVLLAQSAFVILAGQESPIAIVISTLVIAALFNPLRKRIQVFIDRRFYRRSYDAALTLEQFAQTARDEVDLEQLSAVLLHTVNETMQPETAVLWMRSGEEG